MTVANLRHQEVVDVVGVQVGIPHGAEEARCSIAPGRTESEPSIGNPLHIRRDLGGDRENIDMAVEAAAADVSTRATHTTRVSNSDTFFDTSQDCVYGVTMWEHPDRPYQTLPALLPPEGVETLTILKATVAASQALARLDGACKQVPDPTMLINLIP